MKNEAKLNNYYFQDDLNVEIDRFVDYYNNHRYDESPNNVTPLMFILEEIMILKSKENRLNGGL